MRSLCTAILGLVMTGALFAQSAEIPARLSLDEALRIAEARNPQVVSAQQVVVASEADLIGARKRPNPAFSVDSQGFPFSEQERPGFLNDQELSFGVQQDLELGGRRGFRTQVAQFGVETSRETSRDVRRQLRFEVCQAYMRAVLARADDEVARTTLEEIDKVLVVNRARYEQGELSGVELRRLQVERFRFADDQFAAELALKNARSGLLALLNLRPLDQSFDTIDDLALPPGGAGLVPPEAVSASVVAQALTSRPDLAAARREQDRAQAGLRLQQALRTPSLSVGAGLRRDFGSNGLVVNFAMPLQIFDRNQAGVARAEAEGRIAAAQVAIAETAVSLDVQQALNAADVNRRRVAYVEGEYLTNAREARDIVLASYRAGAATLIDYLDAERALREALRILNRARFDYRVSLFQYEAAVGVPAPARGKE
jgi:cobalt-zinc-cadmium efflux system outer membrane protein